MFSRIRSIAQMFFWLGISSFGGPAAHIARFEQVFVRQRGWLSAEAFQQLVAQAHLLPGPSSSQVGFAIGVQRAGLAGGITAFIAFTLPSALLMLLAATQLVQVGGYAAATSVIHGLKLIAAVVVADAVLAMARNFCRSAVAAVLAVLACLLTLLHWPAYAVIVIAAVAVLLWKRLSVAAGEPVARPAGNGVSEESLNGFWRQSAGWLLLWGLLLLLTLAVPDPLWAGFYQSGSLVFGGGHVVLPLLQQSFASGLSADSLLTGYAAAQVMPGPMFTLATYLGALLAQETPVWGALQATLAIFLPGFLLMLAVTPLWSRLAVWPPAAIAIPGINAAVVGILLATLINPVLTTAVSGIADVFILLTGAALLIGKRLGVLSLLVLMSAYGWLQGVL